MAKMLKYRKVLFSVLFLKILVLFQCDLAESGAIRPDKFWQPCSQQIHQMTFCLSDLCIGASIQNRERPNPENAETQVKGGRLPQKRPLAKRGPANKRLTKKQHKMLENELPPELLLTQKSFMDFRKDSEVVCDNRTSHETVAGVELLAQPINDLNPEAPLGDPIFAIEMILGASCQNFQPKGFNLLRTRESSVKSNLVESRSLHKLNRKTGNKITADVGVQVFGVGVSSSFEKSSFNKYESSNETKMTYYALKNTQIDNAATISEKQMPPLEPLFKNFLLRFKNATVFSSKTMQKELFWLLTQRAQHLPRTVKFGSQMIQVRISKLTCK